VVMKAMSKSPDDRYASADEFRADLLRFNQGLAVQAGDPALTGVMGAVGATALLASTGQTKAVPRTAPPGEPSRSERERQKRTRRLVIVLVTLLVVLAVIAYFLLRSLGVIGGTKVDVPSVVGQTVAAATSTLQGDGLTVGRSTTVLSSQTLGTVIATNPLAGSKVDSNTAVNLTVSDGPGVSVPNVVGDQLTQATVKLQQDNLNQKVTSVTSTKPVGTVLSQSPAALKLVKPNTTVDLTVSGTQTLTSVPSVVGFSPAAAGSTLTGSNLTVGSQTSACSNSTSQPSGTISSQSPAAGAMVPPGTPVNLVISSGPCTTTTSSTTSTTTTTTMATVSVPGVINDQETTAVGIISNAGLNPVYSAPNPCPVGQSPNTVYSQSPTGGTVVSQGSTVDLIGCT